MPSQIKHLTTHLLTGWLTDYVGPKSDCFPAFFKVSYTNKISDLNLGLIAVDFYHWLQKNSPSACCIPIMSLVSKDDHD